MKTLVIDNSNTRTKFALAEGGCLTSWRTVIHTQEVQREAVLNLLEGVSYDQVVICSVVPEKQEVLRAAFTVPLHCVSAKSILPIQISYPEPSQIGADRLANGVAACQSYGSPCIIIDSGTAVTFDVIDTAGSYAGGVIAPGLALMTDYFLEKTALLPRMTPTEPQRFIGKSTIEAMNIGAITGFRGLIREILTGMEKELVEQPHIIATGGDASLLSHGIKRIETVDTDLTLRGILTIGLLNLAEVCDEM